MATRLQRSRLWRARVKIDYVEYWIGAFETKAEAMRAERDFLRDNGFEQRAMRLDRRIWGAEVPAERGTPGVRPVPAPSPVEGLDPAGTDRAA